MHFPFPSLPSSCLVGREREAVNVLGEGASAKVPLFLWPRSPRSSRPASPRGPRPWPFSSLLLSCRLSGIFPELSVCSGGLLPGALPASSSGSAGRSEVTARAWPDRQLFPCAVNLSVVVQALTSPAFLCRPLMLTLSRRGGRWGGAAREGLSILCSPPGRGEQETGVQRR